jgi:hypothetical protein
MNKDDSCQINWTINITGNIGEEYEIDVNFTSSFGNDSVPDNHTDDSTITISDRYGWLNVNLSTPGDNFDWVQNRTYRVNATVTCAGPLKAECGNVDASARYNATGATPDTLINITFGATPFYIIDAGTSIYNFNDIGSPSATHKAEFGTTDTVPCGTLACTGLTEFADAYEALDAGGNYSNITSAGDGSNATYAQNSAGIYSLHRFRFQINEDESNIESLTINWKGYGATTSLSGLGVNLYVWNTSGWQFIDNHTATAPEWINASFSDSTNITNFIDTSGYLYLLAVTTTDGSPVSVRISTDYVELAVEGNQNPSSCADLNQSDSCNISWPVNITGVPDYYEIDASFNSSFGASLVPDNVTLSSTIHIIAPSWDSYTGAGCSGQSDFFNPGDIAYVCGDGFTPGWQYDVAVYDSANSRRCFINGVSASGTGRVDTNCDTTGGSSGDWHSQVSTVGGSSITYDANDPDEIAEDLTRSGLAAFEVNIPEFGFILIPLMFSGMIYLSIRRRFLVE